MDTVALLEEIDRVFPLVAKPSGDLIMFHQSGCYECEGVRNDLEQYSEPSLPDNAIRYLHNDMTCLSADGWRWVLPSYLKRCVTQDLYDPVETEFLIYNLSPNEKYEAETKQRLSKLSQEQLACLVHFIEWCENHPHWSEYCAAEIPKAIEFLHSLKRDSNAI